VLILCGYTSPALTDTECRFAAMHAGQAYRFSVTVAVVLNQDETAAQISVQPALDSFACNVNEIC
jgi:hypothetical protein